MESLAAYETHVTDRDKGRVLKKSIAPPHQVQHSQYTAITATMNCGVFWPFVIYKSKTGNDAGPKKIVESPEPGSGRVVKVIVLDER